MTHVDFKEISKARLTKLREWLDKRNLRGLLILDLLNIRYLTGFTGSNGYLLVNLEDAHFLTDSRYKIQSHHEIPRDYFKIHIGRVGYLEPILKLMRFSKGTVGIEAHALSAALYQNLRKEPVSRKLKLVENVVLELRSIKDETEVGLIKKAQEIAEKVLEEVLREIKPGYTTEKDIAAEIDYKIKKLGGDGPSFPTIVASGPHSALPHAKPRNVIIQTNQPLLIDMGVSYNGYASDMTRTFWVGSNPEEDFIKIYEIVKTAKNRAIEEGLIKNSSYKRTDSKARGFIKEKGYGKMFGHGLGHGVGLNIHEKPVINPKSKDKVKSGHVITIEPGIYIQDRFGVRIEDLVWVKDSGIELITSFSDNLITLL